MPFYRVQTEDNHANDPGYHEQEDNAATPYPTSPNEVPIFFIPGILGNGTELAEIIKPFAHSKHPIYVYYDSRFVTNDATNTQGKQTLTEQAKSIANSMKRSLAKGPPIPYVIVGYSFGCPLAVLAAQELKKTRTKRT